MACTSIIVWWLLFIFCFIIFTNPSARAGYDTRSFFKWSLTGLFFVLWPINLCGLFIAKDILLEAIVVGLFTHSWGYESISLKVNVIAWLELKLAYCDVTFQHVSHYAMWTPWPYILYIILIWPKVYPCFPRCCLVLYSCCNKTKEPSSNIKGRIPR